MAQSFPSGAIFGDVDAPDLPTLIATSTQTGSTNEAGPTVGRELEIYDGSNAVSKWAPADKVDLKAAIDQCIAQYDAGGNGLTVDVGDSDPGGESDQSVTFEESVPQIRLSAIVFGTNVFSLTPTGGLARGLSQALA